MFEGTNRGPLKLFEQSGETRLLDCPAQAWQAESVQLCQTGSNLCFTECEPSLILEMQVAMLPGFRQDARQTFQRFSARRDIHPRRADRSFPPNSPRFLLLRERKSSSHLLLAFIVLPTQPPW